MEISIYFNCSDPEQAAALLHLALKELGTKEPQRSVEVELPASVAPPEMPREVAGRAVYADPADPNPATITPQAASTAPSPGIVPTAPAPTITGELVAKAGADLIRSNPAARDGLMALLQKYGVPYAQALKPDQIAPFAADMRALGAQI